MKPTFTSHSDSLDRDLYFLPLANWNVLSDKLDIPSAHFSVFVAGNAKGVQSEVISNFAKKLLDSGAVYFCCYGEDCQRVHDIIDEQIVQSTPSGVDDVIMTTWHDDETLEDGLWFFIENSLPDIKYIDSCKTGLAISIENPERDAQILKALNEPGSLLESRNKIN